MMFLIDIKLDYTKKRGNSPIAHPTFEAFALPTVETDNCRKPTHDIYHPMRGQPQNTNSIYTTTHGRVQYTYREHLPLSCLLTVFGSCEVSKVKDKRQINALFHKSHTHPLSPLSFLRKNAFAKITNISEIRALILFFLCIFAKKKLNIYKSKCYDQLS